MVQFHHRVCFSFFLFFCRCQWLNDRDLSTWRKPRSAGKKTKKTRNECDIISSVQTRALKPPRWFRGGCGAQKIEF